MARPSFHERDRRPSAVHRPSRMVAAAVRAASAIVGAVQGDRGLGQGGDGQTVPGRQGLVVAGRLRTTLSRGEEPVARLGEAPGDLVGWDGVARGQGRVVADPAQDRAALPVARRRDVVCVPEERRIVIAEHGSDLIGGPHVGRTLVAVGISVQAGREGAAGHGHIAQQMVERRLDHLAVTRIRGDLPGVQVGPGQLRVVVEHLLEVRDQPLRIGRIAGEAAAELVVDAARRHGVERSPRHVQRLDIAGAHEAAQEVLDGHRGRELRRATPAATGDVERLAERRRRGIEDGRVDGGADDRCRDGQERTPVQTDQPAGRGRRRAGQERG